MTDSILPSNPNDIEKIAAVIKEIDNEMTMIEARQDYIKEAKKELQEQFELKAAQVNLIVKLYHKQNATEFFNEQDTIRDTYDTLFS